MVKTISGAEEHLSSCAWDPNGKFFLLGSFDNDRSIQQLEMNGLGSSTWETSTRYKTEGLSISFDGRRLIRITNSELVHCFDVESRKLEWELKLPSRATSVSIGRDSRYILLRTSYHGIRLIDINTQSTIQTFSDHQPASKFLIRATLGGLGEEFVLSASEGRINPYQHPSISLIQVLGLCILRITIGGSVYLWHRDTGHQIDRIEGHRLRSNSVAWNPAHPYMFASVGDDGKLKM